MIHPTAMVHPKAEIDPSCEIGPWCVVGPKVRMGKNNKLMSHVVVEGLTTIAEGNTFFPFTVIGAVPQDLKYKGEDTELIIGSHNTIRESVTLNLGTVQGGGVTKLGSHNLLMAYVHLGHDCLVGDHAILSNGTALAGHVIVEDYAILGGMCGVAQFIRVGAHSYVGGQSGLERDLPPFVIAVGTRPAQIKGCNIVGLRRRGWTSDVIQRINEAIKLWIRPDIQKEQCLLEIESQYGELKEIQQFVEFIRKSESGVVR